MKRPPLLPIILIVESLLLVLSLAGNFYLYRSNTQLRDPDFLPKETARRVHEEIKSKVSVPQNEVPVLLGTVSDPEKLDDQAFYRDAKKGDVIVVYIEGKVAVLYRQDEQKVINIGPFEGSSSAASPQVSE